MAVATEAWTKTGVLEELGELEVVGAAMGAWSRTGMGPAPARLSDPSVFESDCSVDDMMHAS